MNRHRQGFTLIELLVVLALIGIMVAIAVPSFASFISNYRATSAINDLLQGITTTRTEALKRGRKVSMVPIGADWRNGWTIFVDASPPDGIYTSGVDEMIFQHAALPPSISVSGTGSFPLPFSGANYVVFDGTGYPRVTTAPFGVLVGGIVLTDTLGSITNRRTLCLATLGRPRIVRDTVETCTNGN